MPFDVKTISANIFHKLYCKIGNRNTIWALGWHQKYQPSALGLWDGIFDATLGPIWYLYSTFPHHGLLKHFWQKFRESNVFTKEITKEVI